MSTLPPVPHRAQVLDKGFLTPIWSDWFKQVQAQNEAILARLVTVEAAAPHTGEILAAMTDEARTGWLIMNSDTLGDDDSGADHEGEDYQALFEHLWEKTLNANLEILDSDGVATTRGASATEDWDAHKRMPLPPPGLLLRGIGSTTINGRTKTGPSALAELQEDQMQKITGSFAGVWATSTVVSGALGDAGAGNPSFRPAGGTLTAKELTLDSSASPDARASSTTDGETLPSALGVNWLIKL